MVKCQLSWRQSLEKEAQYSSGWCWENFYLINFLYYLTKIMGTQLSVSVDLVSKTSTHHSPTHPQMNYKHCYHTELRQGIGKGNSGISKSPVSSPPSLRTDGQREKHSCPL